MNTEKNFRKILRGDVYWADLRPLSDAVKHMEGGIRPVVVISNSYNMIQNLCEIVVWHIFVNFVILISDSNETYRFTMRESNIVNMKGVFSNGKFIFKECLQSIS